MFCCYHNSRFKKLPRMVRCDVLSSEVSYNVALTRSNQREYATSFQTAISYYCVCIIDCSEIFTDIPTRFEARSIMYSNYKKHNTIKFLIGITPCGSISFLSQCWGGRVSDKVITQESNFLRHLEQDDVVLADRGFTIADDLAIHGAKLEIPAFTRGKSQLTQREVEYSKQLSTVRIHVERVIGHIERTSSYQLTKAQR